MIVANFDNSSFVHELDAVLPLTAGDAGRAQLLFRTLERFFEPLATCWVVVPDEQLVTVSRQLPPKRYVAVPESSIVPEIGWFRRTAALRATLRLVGPPIHGWYVQQLVKLAIAAHVQTPYYLTLDADVLCVRPTSIAELVPDGHSVVQSAPPNHPEWNDDAERVLGLRRSAYQYGVTPAVLSRDAVEELIAHVERRVDPRLEQIGRRVRSRAARDILASWRSFLLRRLPWTEYALYYGFLEATARLDRYHVLGGEDVVYGNCVWIESQFDDWDPGAGDAPFTVVQSVTRIPPAAVARKLAAAGALANGR